MSIHVRVSLVKRDCTRLCKQGKQAKFREVFCVILRGQQGGLLPYTAPMGRKRRPAGTITERGPSSPLTRARRPGRSAG